MATHQLRLIQAILATSASPGVKEVPTLKISSIQSILVSAASPRIMEVPTHQLRSIQAILVSAASKIIKFHLLILLHPKKISHHSHLCNLNQTNLKTRSLRMRNNLVTILQLMKTKLVLEERMPLQSPKNLILKSPKSLSGTVQNALN